MKNQLILFLSMLIVNTGLAQMPSAKLIATVLGKFEGIVSKQELIDKGKIEILSKNRNKYKVLSFKMTTVLKGGFIESEECNGDALTTKMLDLISIQRIGKEVFFHSIIAFDKKDSFLLNSIRLKLNDNTIADTLEYSYNKATFNNLIDGQLDTATIRKISKLGLLKNDNDSRISRIRFNSFGGSCWGSPYSDNDILNDYMKRNIRSLRSGYFLYFYDILIFENKKTKHVPPIFIQVGDKIGYGK